MMSSSVDHWSGDWWKRTQSRVVSRHTASSLTSNLSSLSSTRIAFSRAADDPKPADDQKLVPVRMPGGHGAGSKGVEGKPSQPKKRNGKEPSGPWAPRPYSSLALPGVREIAQNPTGNQMMWDAAKQESRPWNELKHERGNFVQGFDPDEMRASPDEAEEYYHTIDPTYASGLQAPSPRHVDAPAGLQPIEYTGEDVDKVGSRGQQNIEQVLALASPEEMAYWSSWYKIAHRTAAQLAVKHGVPLMKAAAVIAVLSPQEEWLNNVQMADRALAGDWGAVNTLVPSREKAYSIVVNDDYSSIRGPKVYPFFLSIYDPEKFQDLVVVDTHAAAIWMGVRAGSVPSISPSARAKMTEDYKKAGAKSGLSPMACQSLAWVLWRMTPFAAKSNEAESDD